VKGFLGAYLSVPLLCLFVTPTPAVAPSEPSLPDQVDLRPTFAKYSFAPKTQGKRDVCSLFAVAGAVEYELAKDNPARPTRLSEEFLIWAANDATGLTGDQAMFYEAVHGLRMLGICSESLMPYETNEDPKRHPSKEALADARACRRWTAHWIKRWDVKTGLTDALLTDIKGELANDHPVAVGLRWPKEERFGQDHVLDIPAADQVRDGHSILFVGYREDKDQPGGGVFLFRNSWGKQWQDGGYARMPYAYAAAYANDAVSLHRDANAAATLHVELEGLRVASASHCPTFTQDMRDFGGKMWGKGKQLFCQCENAGSVTLEFSIGQEGQYRLDLLATLAPDFGKFQVAVDDQRLESPFDAYAGKVQPSGPCELGAFSFNAGKHRLVFTSVGKNSQSQGYFFGINALELTPVK
jgi:Papain family cysteine protease